MGRDLSDEWSLQRFAKRPTPWTWCDACSAVRQAMALRRSRERRS